MIERLCCRNEEKKESFFDQARIITSLLLLSLFQALRSKADLEERLRSVTLSNVSLQSRASSLELELQAAAAGAAAATREAEAAAHTHTADKEEIARLGHKCSIMEER